MFKVCSSMSMNSGLAPAWEMASVVAINVFGTVSTTSPGRTPEAIKAKRSASVPLLTPTQWPESQKVANAFSNSSTIDPPTKLAVRNPLRKMPTSSFSSSRWGATRSRKGTASDSMKLSAGSMKRSTLAGFPATIALRGTSLVTTLPAPTIAFSPTVVLGRILAPEPIDADRKPQYPGRVSCHYRIARNILGDHAAGAHNCILADCGIGKNPGAGADRRTLLNHRPLHFPVGFGLQPSRSEE